ncbi:MAG: hybrid sensor histidine kinase/response regulator [Desulfobacterales bacterium]|nr:hybrid sensor histidine kinase/response regulator [Desulfobacterales bacterium]
MNEEELLIKLREAFKLESEERLASIASGLLELEKISSPDEQKPVLEVIFREAHSLKGAARAVNLIDIETLCQTIEGIFSALKAEKILLSPKMFDILHDSVKVMESVLVPSGGDSSLYNEDKIEQLIHELEDLKLKSQLSNSEAQIPTQKQADNIEQRTEKSELKTGSTEQETEQAEAETKQAEAETKQAEAETNQAEAETNQAEVRTQQPGVTKEQTPDSPIKPVVLGTVRIAASKLDSLLLDVEELTSLKLIAGQRQLNLRDIVHSFENWKKQWIKMEPEYRKLRSQVQKQEPGQLALLHTHTERRSKLSPLAKMLEFINWNKEYIQSAERAIRMLTKSAEQDNRMLSRMVDDLMSDMKKVIMLPFSTLFEVFPMMIRDLSKKQGKEVDLVITGSEIEIDRRILEEIKDPLIHILRNAVDHGLEEPEDRLKQQKQRQGVINLCISQTDGNKVEINISDDGKGIDSDRIKEEAVKSGLLSEKEAGRINDNGLLSLIFQSGLSSSRIITEISGRGLGLAIVQEKVEKLGGLLSVNTKPGKGTSFTIKLPVTLATFRGVLVRVSDELFIVPASYTDRVMKVRYDDIKTVENRATIPLDEQVVPLLDLADVLKIKPRPVIRDNQMPDNRKNSGIQLAGIKFPITVIVLGTGQNQAAFRVEEVICEQEVLVKSLGRQLARVPRIAGATIMGSGKVVPILNVHDLLKVKETGFYEGVPQAAEDETSVSGLPDSREKIPGSKGSVLIAEDSITSRMLIKNILEAAGYSVKTAVDGRDAYSALKTEAFDVVVSDVEMPRMTGFELTEKIRGNAKLAETPVILVTSLSSREDKERGIDVGADAYIVKSNFDQSNLLEVIDRLI